MTQDDPNSISSQVSITPCLRALPKRPWRGDILAPLLIAVLTAGAISVAISAHAQSLTADLPRPAVENWISVGTTVRASTSDPATPNEFHHVQIEPGAYRLLAATKALPDGAILAVTFYSARREPNSTPALFAPDKEQLFALEVLDKTHPDGRRFYTYTPSAKTARALPAGNSCAMCHNARGSLQGTFAHDYPLTAVYARPVRAP